MDDKAKQIGLDCLEIINKKLSRQINKEDYYLALMELYKKYPMTGHNPLLTKYQLEYYWKIKEIHTNPDTGVKYWDHIYPWNFQESAEMFIRHWSKLDNLKDLWKRKTWPLHIESTRELRDKKLESTGEDLDEVPF